LRRARVSGFLGWGLKGEGRAHLLGVLGGPCREKKEVMRGRGARLLRDSFRKTTGKGTGWFGPGRKQARKRATKTF
jgi:hypothetical protein